MENKIVCETCQQEGKTSKLYQCGTTSTLMHFAPFIDENGKQHYHDGNRAAQTYTCSNGHQFSKKVTNNCWCGWNSS